MFNHIYPYKYSGSRLRLFILLSVLCFYTCSTAAQELIIKDCTTNEAIEDVIVYKDKRFMGVSNQAGLVRFKDTTGNLIFHFKKLGAIDTVIVLAANQTSVCLISNSNELPIVTVEGKQIPLHKQFEMFINKNKEFLSPETDTLYYSFTTSRTIPESDLKYEMNGIVMIPLKSPVRSNLYNYWNACYCSLHVKVDSGLINTTTLLDHLHTESGYFFGYDPLKKGVYIKKIKEEMVVDKVVYNDSTRFFFKDYGYTKEFYFYSLPVFNKDSILVRDEFIAEEYDKNRDKSDAIKLNQKEATLQYLLKEHLHLYHLKVYTTSNVKFELQLLDKKPDDCAYISILNLVRNNEIIDHPAVKIEVVQD